MTSEVKNVYKYIKELNERPYTTASLRGIKKSLSRGEEESEKFQPFVDERDTIGRLKGVKPPLPRAAKPFKIQERWKKKRSASRHSASLKYSIATDGSQEQLASRIKKNRIGTEVHSEDEEGNGCGTINYERF